MEVEATVADYLDMLAAELHDQAYNKAAHRRRLLPRLDNRTEGAIERKHGNISAILIELGFPYIEGYKPFSNYQRLLFDVVASRLEASPDLHRLAATDVEAPATHPTVDDILASLVAVPTRSERSDRVRESARAAHGSSSSHHRIDYLQREAANASLGAAGERFALEFERARLVAAGKERLAGMVEHVSSTRGDGDGFDILSYEESGRERFIEVKTTKYGAQTPFFVSANEVEVSAREADRYHLYRIFGFRRTPKLFSLPGPISTNFSLVPIQYRAGIA